MIKILLQNFRCIARHGVYAEEQITGAEYEVNLEVSFEETGLIEKLDQSISYSHLQEIVKSVMAEPNHLLETVCQQITTQIKAGYPFVSEINITLCKLAPPIVNFQGRVGVNYVKKF
jgi:7,8-dihydroneopterin aldolase/epimerase/oxygenase